MISKWERRQDQTSHGVFVWLLMITKAEATDRVSTTPEHELEFEFRRSTWKCELWLGCRCMYSRVYA